MIYRPGLLMCARAEPRTFERVARGIAYLIDRSERFSVSADRLAAAAVAYSLKSPPAGAEKVEVFEHHEIVAMVRELAS